MARPVVRCPRCRHRAAVRPRSRSWWLALAAAAAVFVALVLAASLIGPFIMFAIPVIATVGFAFGPLHSLAAEDPTCARCGRILTVPPTAKEARAVRRQGPAPRATPTV